MIPLTTAKPLKILMVYIEPTPYVIGLITTLIDTYKGQIEILFLGENISQQWNIPLPQQWQLLPSSLKTRTHCIYQLFFKKQYDLMHLAGWGTPLLLFFIITAKLLRIPTVIESDTPLSNQVKWWKRIIKKLCYPIFFQWIHLFLPAGKKQADYFKYYGVKPKYIMPVHMTVDVTKIKNYIDTLTVLDRCHIRQRYHLDENHIVFLFVGRLVEYKGILDLISAFNRVRHLHTILLIVGGGPLHLQIEAIVKTNPNIRYAGRLSGQALMDIYYAADVCVLPSHIEPWGLVINEAMATHLPVIVSDQVGCIDDLVIHQETGIIVKAKCITELQVAIEELANFPQKRAAMAKQSALKISTWTLENEAQKICQAWCSLQQ